jgi:hypothetical protein
MELLLKNVQEKHLGLIAELARTLKITIEGQSDTAKTKPTVKSNEEKQNLEEGLFLSWINK